MTHDMTHGMTHDMKRLGSIKPLVLPAFALAGMVWLVVSGFWPGADPYMTRHSPGPQPYPLTAVLIACAVVLIETALVAAVLRPASYRHSWGRALVALAAVMAWWFYLGMGIIHQAGYYIVHLQWLALMISGLILLLLVSLIRRLPEARAGVETR
jgi:hypothetical protein